MSNTVTPLVKVLSVSGSLSLHNTTVYRRNVGKDTSELANPLPTFTYQTGMAKVPTAGRYRLVRPKYRPVIRLGKGEGGDHFRKSVHHRTGIASIASYLPSLELRPPFIRSAVGAEARNRNVLHGHATYHFFHASSRTI